MCVRERERERERERVKFSFRCDTKITHKVRAGLGVVVYYTPTYQLVSS